MSHTPTSYRAKHCNYVYHASQPGASVTSCLGPTLEKAQPFLWRISVAPTSGRLAEVCFESRHFLRMFSSSKIFCYCLSDRGDGITETHKQLDHIHQTGGREQALSHSFPFSPSVFHTFTHLHNTHMRAHTHTNTHTNIHTHRVPGYVHDLTRASKAYEHLACCHAKFSTLSTHRQIPSLYTSELFWTLEIITHE